MVGTTLQNTQQANFSYQRFMNNYRGPSSLPLELLRQSTQGRPTHTNNQRGHTEIVDDDPSRSRRSPSDDVEITHVVKLEDGDRRMAGAISNEALAERITEQEKRMRENDAVIQRQNVEMEALKRRNEELNEQLAQMRRTSGQS